MSSAPIVRILLLTAIFSTVVSYSVLSTGDSVASRPHAIRFWQPMFEPREYETDEAEDDSEAAAAAAMSLPSSEFDGRIKRGLDDIEQQLSKRTNLKRLVILSARGFGRK